jgi:hypothetical protein
MHEWTTLTFKKQAGGLWQLMAYSTHANGRRWSAAMIWGMAQLKLAILPYTLGLLSALFCAWKMAASKSVTNLTVKSSLLALGEAYPQAPASSYLTVFSGVCVTEPCLHGYHLQVCRHLPTAFPAAGL